MILPKANITHNPYSGALPKFKKSMFSLFKRKDIKQNYQHHTERTDWERLLDELFLQIIHPSKNGVAIISNTCKKDPSDAFGAISPKLGFRVDNSTPAALQSQILNYDIQKFSSLFAYESKMRPYLYDCYKIRNVGLPNNALIYFIYYKQKKAILLFAPPIFQGELMRYVEKISNLLKTPNAENETALPPIPKSFPPHQFSKVKSQQLKARLTYLEDLDTRTEKEEKEMQALEEYIMEGFRKKF